MFKKKRRGSNPSLSAEQNKAPEGAIFFGKRGKLACLSDNKKICEREALALFCFKPPPGITKSNPSLSADYLCIAMNETCKYPVTISIRCSLVTLGLLPRSSADYKKREGRGRTITKSCLQHATNLSDNSEKSFISS